MKEPICGHHYLEQLSVNLQVSVIALVMLDIAMYQTVVSLALFICFYILLFLSVKMSSSRFAAFK